MSRAALLDRLARRSRRVRVLGLTGSIGMGKTTTAAMARRLGCPVHNADAVVHALMRPGGPAVRPILAAFPTVADATGGIDRKALGRLVFGNPSQLRRLESIVHPLVRAAERAFLARQARARRPVVVLDIPLLFETKGETRCDRVAVVWAPEVLRTLRVLARPGMTASTLAHVRSLQTTEAFKRANADALIPTGLGHRPAWVALRRVLQHMRQGPACPSRRRLTRTVRPHA
ncbi:dephospho-CoA kinase [Pararhodospirillum oryzae]|uniref:Dephospho-CoA kinase n=1 Tax=Pararhodospirillum oryzae TaxID=478448 RepID=A0A512H3L4_9PROT|nr:dephospho-CoA kinase [Pararhodospirillum oryzae]GEO80056.1 dephospho-CoA kinase [Pararhodospirillum oryzae]